MTATQTTSTESKPAEARATGAQVESEVALHPLHATTAIGYAGGVSASGIGDGPAGSRAHLLARFHRSIGNQAMLRTIGAARLRVQTKLTVNQPGDQYEEEADRVAVHVMRLPEPSPEVLSPAIRSAQRIQRCSCGGSCDECSGKTEATPSSLLVQTKRRTNSSGTEIHSRSVDQHTLLRGGVPMDAALRQFYEMRFGYDFSMVRLHAGPEAEDINEQFEARAFTFGEHIWMGESQRSEPSYVLAHELAHVIQQKQPPRTREPHSPALRRNSFAGLAETSIQRLPFFVPIDTRLGKFRGGTDLHSRILGAFSGARVEAPVPNAVRNTFGLDFQGEADLYTSDSGQTVGIYFSGKTGEQNPRISAVEPKKHRASLPFANNSPDLSPTGGIVLVGKGPAKIALNEMKPANKDMLKSGALQLGWYRKGFELANRLTNEWFQIHKDPRKPAADKWDLKSVTNNPIGTPPGPENVELALADISDSGGKGGDFTVKTKFLPKFYLGQVIPGQLRVEYYRDGLWMYYARPDNIANALALPAGRGRAQVQAAMQVAILVQDEVIGGLKAAPQQGSAFPKSRSPILSTSPLHRPAIQRKKEKPPKLEDKFEFSHWNRTRSDLGAVIRKDRVLDTFDPKTGAVKSQGGGKAFSYLQFLELAVKADEGLDEALPKKSSLKQSPEYKEIASLTANDKAGKTLGHTPFELYTWVERWTSKPVEALGYFRSTFKNVFVRLANLISGYGKSLKDSLLGKIAAKLQGLFDSFSKGEGGSRLRQLAIDGVRMAVKQLGTILLPNVIHIMATTIKSGVEKKLKELFKLEFGDLVDDTFHKFDHWRQQAEDFAKSFDTIFEGVTTVLDTISEIVDVFHKVTGYISDAADSVRLGIYALECEGVISCLAILLKPLQDRAIAWLGEKALKTCGVRYLLAKGVHKLFGDLPKTIAQGALKLLSKLVPSSLEGLRDIFTGDVKNEPLPDPSEIVDDDCISIDLGFSVLDGFQKSPQKGALGEKAAKDDVEELKKFTESVPKEELEALSRLMQENGITDETPMTRDTLEKLQSALEKVEAKELNDLAEGKAVPGTAAKLRPLTDLLGKIGQQKRPGSKPSQPAKPKVSGPAIPPPAPPSVPPSGPTQPGAPARPTSGQAPPVSAPIPIPDKAPQQDQGGLWAPTDVHIAFVEGEPRPGLKKYWKSLDTEILLSQDKPKYSLICIPFSGSVFFLLDYYGKPRPASLKPPTVSVSWKIGGKVVASHVDSTPQYRGAGHWLGTSFPNLFTFPVNDKDIVEMEFSIEYEEGKPPLVYRDKIEIDAQGCA
jgi:hypothetical protein